MSIQITKNHIISLVQESESEFLLNEVCKILELGSENSLQLTTEEMDELEAMERKHDASKLQTASWKEIREKLLRKLQV